MKQFWISLIFIALVAILFYVCFAIIFYHNHDPFINSLIGINEYLESASISFNDILPSISVLDLAGSILACLSYRHSLKTAKSWFESLIACILMQFGGTTLTGLLLGQTPSWILSQTAFPAFIVAWWLTFFCPLDLYYKYVSENYLFILVCGLFSSISSGHSVTSWGLDKAAFNTFHADHTRISRSALTCILAGTLSACGGGLIASSLRLTHSTKSFTLTVTPPLFARGKFAATATANRAFWLAIIYFCLLNHTGSLPWAFQLAKQPAHLLVSVLQIAAFVAHEAAPHIDVFQSLSTFVLTRVCQVTDTVGGSGKDD